MSKPLSSSHSPPRGSATATQEVKALAIPSAVQRMGRRSHITISEFIKSLAEADVEDIYQAYQISSPDNMKYFNLMQNIVRFCYLVEFALPNDMAEGVLIMIDKLKGLMLTNGNLDIIAVVQHFTTLVNVINKECPSNRIPFGIYRYYVQLVTAIESECKAIGNALKAETAVTFTNLVTTLTDLVNSFK